MLIISPSVICVSFIPGLFVFIQITQASLTTCLFAITSKNTLRYISRTIGNNNRQRGCVFSLPTLTKEALTRYSISFRYSSVTFLFTIPFLCVHKGNYIFPSFSS